MKTIQSTDRDEQVAANVRAELRKQGMSQAALARGVHVSAFLMSRRLSSKVSFNVDELQQIAEVLDVPVEQFLRGAA
jgi:transcriptional regulator with XRE-family HTH domain